MSFRYSRTIIGYHGCSRETADSILSGEPFHASTGPVEWLGDGIYFWEYGYERARNWAENKAKSTGAEPAVVGAVIHLGHCFDLLDIRSTQALNGAYQALAQACVETRQPIQQNRGRDDDLKARYLDCAVINFWMELAELEGIPYDTVRGVFQEGDPAFPGAMIRAASHIQVAVRNPRAIIGVFLPTSEPPLSLAL